MKVSVVIPAYNCVKTVRPTLDSVLNQTIPADEVIVLDDGSTDETPTILESYLPRITVVRQTNQGVASTRNTLCKLAKGDLVAFLDNDDLWHPTYLQVQRALFEAHPEAVAFFTGHANFSGDDGFDWKSISLEPVCAAELIPPLEFLTRYNEATGYFASMSYCCVPKAVLSALGDEPFHAELSGVDDSYLCTSLPLLGSVVLYPSNLVAYRFSGTNQSRNRLKMFGLWVDVFRHLEQRYKEQAKPDLMKAFMAAYAARRRAYAKVLLGVRQGDKARQELARSVIEYSGILSMWKSIGLLFLSYMPSFLQPSWPSAYK